MDHARPQHLDSALLAMIRSLISSQNPSGYCNASSILLMERPFDQSGSVVVCSTEMCVSFFWIASRIAGKGLVTDRTTKESRREKPQALNTVELMRVASSSFGISPASTMSVAEQLYTQGFISYPRTETTAYPPNFDLVGTLKQQSNNPKWGDVVRKVLNDGIRKPKSGEDKGDHPPITPMKPNNGQLSGDMARIYDYVVQHFVATLMGPCIYDVTTVTI
ncbi:hypothetical protein COOONC_24114 [Cooperia oncophora]